MSAAAIGPSGKPVVPAIVPLPELTSGRLDRPSGRVTLGAS